MMMEKNSAAIQKYVIQLYLPMFGEELAFQGGRFCSSAEKK